MGAMIEVNLQEIKQLAQRLNSFALGSEQRQRLLHSLGKEVAAQTKARFDEERDPGGDKWRALTEAYAKRKGDSSGGILVRGGNLLQTITFNVENEWTVIAGSPMEYADYHQNAKNENRKRAFLGLNAENIADLDSMIDVFMKGEMYG